MYTTAQVVEMSFDVPDSEKAIAKKAVHSFKRVVEKVEALDNHLNYLHQPFSSHQNVSTKSIMENRGALIRYKRRVRENFQKVARAGLICVASMNQFATDNSSSFFLLWCNLYY